MKITRVQPILVRTPLKLDDAQPHAGGLPKNDVHTVLVKVETDDGVIGWGEAFSNAGWQSTVTAIAQIIAPRVVGRDASQIAQIQADLHRGLYNTGRSGPTVFAISGLDIALWDIAAKRAGLPLYKLLGGSARETLPAYASLLRYGDAKVVERKTKEAIYPPDDHSGLARLRTTSRTPIAAGENISNFMEFKRLFEVGAVGIAQPSVTKIGGITEMRKIFALGEANGVVVVPHSPYFGPGLLASIHVCAASAREIPIERYYCDF